MLRDLSQPIESIDAQYWLDREGVTYRRTTGSNGTQLNIKTCPFCGGGNWKVYMNAKTGLGNCFHGDCQKKFNKGIFFNALLGLNGKDFEDYVLTVAEEVGWREKFENKAKEPEQIFDNTNFNMPNFVPIINYFRLGIKSQPALKYLMDRGISPESIEHFRLGDCIDGYFQYKKPDGNLGYQNYSQRIIIPIFDENGKTVTFQGRDYSGKADKRYLFPPGLNSSGTLFYNGWNAKGCEQVIIGEGVFDCIAIHQAIKGESGFENICALASFGKHLSMANGNSQLSYLFRLKKFGLKVITLMWDGENEAIKDAVKVALSLVRYGFKTRIAILPKGKDPNEVPQSTVVDAFWSATTINQLNAVKILSKLV